MLGGGGGGSSSQRGTRPLACLVSQMLGQDKGSTPLITLLVVNKPAGLNKGRNGLRAAGSESLPSWRQSLTAPCSSPSQE